MENVQKMNTQFERDFEGKRLIMTRIFKTTPEKIWKAFSDASVLDQWWAPKPWKCETREMQFEENGHWLYAMVGPQGEKHWGMLQYHRISPVTGFTGRDFFCDENGVPNLDLPGSDWDVKFIPVENGVKLYTITTFKSEAEMKTLIEMGVEMGSSMAQDTLEEILQKMG